MKDRNISAIYAKIAYSIAKRIADNEIKENTRIYGRSIMASEYSVSPETIRRALKLLADMKIVEVKQNSGYIVLSREKARQYVLSSNEYMDVRTLQRELRELVVSQEKTSRNILDIVDSIVYSNEKFYKHNLFQAYETPLPDNSPLPGKSINEINFWHHTWATIIAIRRDDIMILSPDPNLELLAGDKLVYVCNPINLDCVEQFLNKQDFDPTFPSLESKEEKTKI